MSRPLFVVCASVGLSLYACSSSETSPVATDAGSVDASSDEDGGGGGDSATKDAGSSDTGKVDTTPAAVTLTGKIAPTCTKFPAPPPEWDCNLNVTSLVMSPAPPAGSTVPDMIEISSENKKAPDTGWIAGLQVTKPSYPATCLQNLAWFSSSANLAYHVFDKVENGGTCGLATTQHADVTPADFPTGFSATLKVTWKPSGKVIPATISFTK